MFVVLHTGVIDRHDGLKVELITAEQLQLPFSCPPVLLGSDGIMNAIMLFRDQLKDVQGPLMAQVLGDYHDPVHC